MRSRRSFIGLSFGTIGILSGCVEVLREDDSSSEDYHQPAALFETLPPDNGTQDVIIVVTLNDADKVIAKINGSAEGFAPKGGQSGGKIVLENVETGTEVELVAEYPNGDVESFLTRCIGC